ncbi:hypothetical protein AB0M20_42990, partial [Actinoplanes sp. NPDC051633]|uniref:hypothetical protein n=1 Tax=Actinoplanes sp. NPDC051633 TaxID=3155670 RepID=UPI00342E9FFD
SAVFTEQLTQGEEILRRQPPARVGVLLVDELQALVGRQTGGVWPFDQQGNTATSQNGIFNIGSVVYLTGFWVLMAAVIGAHGRQASRAGRLGTFGVSAALLGTMALGGNLWFESFAVPWLAGGPLPEVLESDPSILFALGTISSYALFAIGWVAFGVAALRARVFPVWISVLIVIGGIFGYQALLSPWGIPLGLAVAALGAWMLFHRSVTGPAAASSIAR